MEVKESYQEQIAKIRSMGSIKEIVNDKNMLLDILTYNGDRHLIAFFYEMLSQAIQNGEVLPEDLGNIRSGWLADSTIHLKDLLGRELYEFEIGDKVNYISLLKDVESQVASFSRPEIIEAIAGTTPNRELEYCQNSFYSWSLETRLKIIEEVLKAGNVEKALMLLHENNRLVARDRVYEEEARGRH